jgi:hypothetical protein
MVLMQKLMTLVEVEEARAIMREDDDAVMIAIAFAVRLDIMTFGVRICFRFEFYRFDST